MKLKFDRTTYILVAGMAALVIFSVIFIHIKTEKNYSLRERNQALQDNLDTAEKKISALKTLIGSAPTPHPALPSAGDLDNWSGGLWKMISENGSVLASQGEVPFNVAWLDEVEKVSAVYFDREVDGWESLRFVAIEFLSVTSAENAFVFIKGRAENAEWENLYAVSSDEDLIRFNTRYTDYTVFRKDKALFMVDLMGDNVERLASAPYAEFLKSRI